MAPMRLPLDECHRRAGARMVPFGGWELPLEYPTGTIAEHVACRSGAVVFDVSHLGTVRVDGPGSLDRLQAALSNDLTRIGPGRAQYTHLLDEADGSVLDDLIVWWLDDERFDVLPNASNTERVRSAIGGVDVTESRALLAVQGPTALDLLDTVVAGTAQVRRFRVERLEWDGVEVVVGGTGYTGEAGVEIAVTVAAAGRLWDAVVGAGIAPAGLGARDTLRLEAALPLHGHELGPGITPLQVGLGWVVAWDKPVLPGRQALEDERANGVSRHLVGIATPGRRPPRAGCDVHHGGAVVGTTTSGNYSPTLGHGIALAFVPPEVEAGADIEVDVRGSRLAGAVVDTPFVRRS